MTLILEWSLALALVGQADVAPGANSGTEGAYRLAFMQASVLAYNMHPLGHPEAPFKLQREPVLRFNNPVGRARDGTVFLWFGPEGRPEVAAQATLNLRGVWVHEFTSLSEKPFEAVTDSGPVWTPARGGVELRPVPDAPRPAATVEQRLAQMRALAREFAVEDNFERKGWQPLRPLPKPFARYGAEGTALKDGALFCYAITTDPEAYLMIEARGGAERDALAWHYAFAPSTVYPLRATWKGTEVWKRNIERGEGGPTNTLFQRPYSRENVPEQPKSP